MKLCLKSRAEAPDRLLTTPVRLPAQFLLSRPSLETMLFTLPYVFTNDQTYPRVASHPREYDDTDLDARDPLGVLGLPKKIGHAVSKLIRE